MRKLLLLTLIFMFVFQSMSFAAISGSKGAPPAPSRPAPSVSAPAPSSPASVPSSPGTTSGYKPSAPANSYSDKAPAAAKPQQQTQQSNGSSFWRTAGLLGGGMLLGSMLGGMVGFGNSGMFSQIIGMLFSIIPFILIFLVGRYAWNRFQASREKKDSERLS